MLARRPTHTGRHLTARLGVALALTAGAAAGCGGDDDSDGDGSKADGGGAPQAEPRVTLRELRTCLERARVPVGGTGRLAGQGVRGEIPLLIVGSGGLESGTNVLVFESPDAARGFAENPPRAASLLEVSGRTGNVVKARSPQPSGQGAGEPSKEDAAIDRCVRNP